MLSTSAFGAECTQPGVGASGVVGSSPATGGEDCLTLNVWTPHLTLDRNAARPVLFFIHGGAHVVASTSAELAPGLPAHDGTALAATVDAVVVTTQYRLGPLGFIGPPALSAESDYGLLDQIEIDDEDVDSRIDPQDRRSRSKSSPRSGQRRSRAGFLLTGLDSPRRWTVRGSFLAN